MNANTNTPTHDALEQARPLLSLSGESQQLIIGLDETGEQISLRFVPMDTSGAPPLPVVNVNLSAATAKAIGRALLAFAITQEVRDQHGKDVVVASGSEGAEGGAA